MVNTTLDLRLIVSGTGSVDDLIENVTEQWSSTVRPTSENPREFCTRLGRWLESVAKGSTNVTASGNLMVQSSGITHSAGVGTTEYAFDLR